MRGLLLVLVLVAGTAHAESPAEQRARVHYQSAQRLFDAASYAEALAEYQKSYELSRYPAILHRVAQCHDMLAHTQTAIAAYRRYLDEDPTSSRRAAVEERVRALEATLKPTTPSPTPPPPEVAPTPVVAPSQVVAPAPDRARDTPKRRTGLWIGLGVGGGLLVIGGLLVGVLATRPAPLLGGTLGTVDF